MGFGIMFHHFHSRGHEKRPGSIDEAEFDQLICHLKSRYSILDPEHFLERLLNGSLRDSDIVLSFDDSLLSQFDIALPVLKSHSIKGIFNVYSSVFMGNPDPLELFAIFRASEFEEFDDFWGRFLEVSGQFIPDAEKSLNERFPEDWLSNFTFYSRNEKMFRFMRDRVLSREQYSTIMFELMTQTPTFNSKSAVENVWMKKEHLAEIVVEGHSVGLHSHTHPTQMADLAVSVQREEYSLNKTWIESQLGVTPDWVAHPCGNYSEITLKILEELGIQGGFRSSLTSGRFGSNLEIPREDHANVMLELHGL